jgi:Uma2 family endonuclease
MATATASLPQRIVLDNVSWRTYEALLDEFGERPIRFTYDDGSLEIMTLSLGHESYGRLLGRFVDTLTLELNIPQASGGSTTLKKKLKKKGLEPDECYWIKNERRMRGKKEFDIRSDPAPDLSIEVDIFSSSLDRLGIYAALGVPEIWRYDGKALHFLWLGDDGKYRARPRSLNFPVLAVADLQRFLHKAGKEDETSLVRSFAAWVRSALLPVHQLTKP